jgi:hypothetical protein
VQPSATCSAAEHDRRAKALAAYKKAMPKQKAAYFKTHKRAKQRAAYVKAQQVELKRLRQRASCSFAPSSPSTAVPVPPPPGTTTGTPPTTSTSDGLPTSPPVSGTKPGATTTTTPVTTSTTTSTTTTASTTTSTSAPTTTSTTSTTSTTTTTTSTTTTPLPACSDGKDNDGDGAIDYPADPGCSSQTDTNERGTIACDDGTDNDSDRKIDYPADSGCTGPADTSELDPGCAASYPDFCIPPPPPDLDCADVPHKNFTVLWNVPNPDPHQFDKDMDGIGCEG